MGLRGVVRLCVGVLAGIAAAPAYAAFPGENGKIVFTKRQLHVHDGSGGVFLRQGIFVP